jgi:ATP-dependent Clp protease protease subunit
MTTTLRLDTEILEDSANLLRDRIAAVPAGNRIELRINSPGGLIFSGTMLLNALKSHRGGVDTVIESLGASMAGVLFMVGESRTMAKGSRLMIHEPWANLVGDAADFRKQADLLDSLKSDIINVFTAKSGLSADRLSEMMADETWLTAEEALEYGFATGIVGDASMNMVRPEALAKFGFKHVPEDLAKKPEIQDMVPTSNLVDMQANVANLQNSLQLRTKERDEARNALARVKSPYDSLGAFLRPCSCECGRNG